ncbi:FHA domain-containing protein [Brevibacterium permense]|uniref:FHA domain-containing protein n=1 Tax=Brevibacterium permense TaxID=234834 RepID=A0ABN1ZYS7_9MICO
MSQNHDQNRPTPSQPWYDNGQVPQSKKFPFGAGNGNGADESATRMNPQVDQNGRGNTPPYGQQPADDAPPAPQYGNGQNHGGTPQGDQQYGNGQQFGGTPQGGQNYGGTPQGGQQYGNGQQFGGTPQGGQNYGASQPASQPYAGQGQGSQGQPQYQPQNYGQQQSGQPQGSQGQTQYGSNGAGQFAQPQGSQGQQQNYPQQGGQQQYGSNGAGQYGQFDPNQQRGSQPGPGQYGQPQSGQAQSGQPQGAPTNGGQGPSNDSGSQQFQGILDPHTGEIHPVPDLDGLQDADALLVVVSGPDSGSQILLDTDVVTVGRSPNADIFLDDVTVSRKHAEFIRTPSGFTLRDTGSLNGTYVGRQLIDSIELQNGADVQIGKFRMIFQQRPRS